MTFTTPTFALFLALVFALYWSLRAGRAQNVLLLIASYIFYASWDYRFCAILLATSLLDYGVGLWLAKTEASARRRLILFISLAWNLGVLGCFKYFNFFIENLQLAAARVGWRLDAPTLRIILPIGISFYTFKSLSYTIDVYRRQLKPTAQPIEYLAYISFFPQLLAGPIDRAAHLLPQFQKERRFDYALAVDGCRQILWGCFKKMVLADNLTPIVDRAYGAPQTTPGPHLMLATLCFAWQIYCDFSAYSDIAIGAAKLLGFDSMRNFAYPYFSQSMAEFWRRWHISLTTWFRDYVYFSLGGVRGTALRRSVNIVITFLLSGLWHGASWNFLLWGGFNGLAIVPEMFRGRQRGGRKASVGSAAASALSRKASALSRKASAGDFLLPSPKMLRQMLGTFALASLIWVLFRAETLAQAALIYRKMLFDSLNVAAYRAVGTILAASPIGNRVLLFLLLFICIEWAQRRREHPLVINFGSRLLRWTIYTALILLTLRYGAHATGQFVYFKF